MTLKRENGQVCLEGESDLKKKTMFKACHLEYWSLFNSDLKQWALPSLTSGLRILPFYL